ncbi:hypothetical protein [Flavobacterium subsaxonicum]|nr:hypothetical protein [Flavobacterium subsaxonicum]
MFILAGLIIVAVIIAIPFTFYWIPTKLGYPKTGKILGAVVGLSFTVILFRWYFEDELFTKNEAAEFLKEQNIELHDDFEIVSNWSSSGIGEYHHLFTLKITLKDKAKIVNEIRTSDNFTPGLQEERSSYIDLDRNDYNTGPKELLNYETKDAFIRELFRSRGKGFAPEWKKIKIDKIKDELHFSEIDD